MKKFAAFIAVLLGLCSFEMHSQTIAVESFTLAQTDMTANLEGTSVKDQNGEVCALIKLETTQKGFTFDVGVLGVTSVVEHPAEIWIYVPFGIRKITIQHPQLGMLRDYQIPCSIERGRTYVMKITAGSVRTIVEHAVTHQFLYIELDPADAILEIDGKIKPTKNGVYQELVPFGKHQYRSYSPNYHDAVGVVQVSDPENTHKLKLKLKPAFGFVSIPEGNRSELTDAAVYIDGNYAGVVPVSRYRLSSGSHTIRIIKEMYQVYESTFTVSDEQDKVLSPAMVPDFAEITLKTVPDAGIYVNGEFMGKGAWTGRLASGSYIFESRKDGHISSKLPYDVSSMEQSKVITIQDPTPIHGSLIISSVPSGARITVDGNHVGQTPKLISNQVIGTHQVTVELEGYMSQTSKVTIKKGKDSSVNFTLDRCGNLSSEGSANCYMISSSGNYKFAAVKGNSSVSVGDVSSVSVLWESFGTNVTPKVGDLISSVSYSNGYITFSTPSAYKEGNALIAAKDAYGNILWSWHIWFTDIPKGQVYYNNAGTMMDRNLGATSASPGSVESFGLLYQWGRKDPFLGSADLYYCNESKSTTTWPESVISSSGIGTIEYATSHPTTFIRSNEKNKDWYYTGGSTTDRTRWTTSDKPKSIYDPCPAGWRVPDGGKNGVWHKATGIDQISHGCSHSDTGTYMGGFIGSDSSIWYPFAGYRYRGYVSGVGFFGYCWSATSSESTSLENINDANILLMINTMSVPRYTGDEEQGNVFTKCRSTERAVGCSVRCIKE